MIPDDPVAMYLREISDIQPLTKAEETTLFRELAGTIATEQAESAERRLIESQLPLVVSIARRYEQRGLSMLDLIQEGNLGLMKSVRSFAEKPSGDFVSHAATCIDDAIRRILEKA